MAMLLPIKGRHRHPNNILKANTLLLKALAPILITQQTMDQVMVPIKTTMGPSLRLAPTGSLKGGTNITKAHKATYLSPHLQVLNMGSALLMLKAILGINQATKNNQDLAHLVKTGTLKTHRHRHMGNPSRRLEEVPQPCQGLRLHLQESSVLTTGRKMEDGQWLQHVRKDEAIWSVLYPGIDISGTNLIS
ncbi:hypothetical protein P7C71_g1462, partial [Lecanoromycetidae sp. Uapishka_2]